MQNTYTRVTQVLSNIIYSTNKIFLRIDYYVDLSDFDVIVNGYMTYLNVIL